MVVLILMHLTFLDVV